MNESLKRDGGVILEMGSPPPFTFSPLLSFLN